MALDKRSTVVAFDQWNQWPDEILGTEWWNLIINIMISFDYRQS